MPDIEDTVLFHNPMPEDFTFRWDSKLITVKAKATVSMVYYKACHGCKHLIDRIILHPNAKEIWKELGLQRDDLEEIANKETNAVLKAGRDLNRGRDDIEKLILVADEITTQMMSPMIPTEPEKKIEPVKTEEEFADAKNLN